MLFNLVLLYIIIFYFQPGSRFEALEPLRPELLIGSCILIAIFLTKQNKILVNNNLNRSISLLFLAIFFSMFGAFYTRTVSSAIEVLIDVFKYFSVYLMIISTVDSEKKLKRFIKVYLFMIAFYFIEPFVLYNLGMKELRYANGVGHLYAIGRFAHYNSLGGITVSSMAFFSQYFVYNKRIFIKLLLLSVILVGVKVIILTGSRTAYVGFIVMLCLIAIMSKRKFIIVPSAILLAILIFAFMPQEYQERFLTLKKTTKVVAGDNNVNDTINKRWIIIKDAWKVFLKYPVFGCGLDSFWRVRGVMFNRWQQTHNLYMQILSNIGLIGMLAFIYFCYQMFKSLFRIKKALAYMRMKNSFLYYTANAIFLFMLMRLTVGMFGHDLYENYWWLCAGLVFVLNDLTKKHYALALEQNVKS